MTFCHHISWWAPRSSPPQLRRRRRGISLKSSCVARPPAQPKACRRFHLERHRGRCAGCSCRAILRSLDGRIMPARLHRWWTNSLHLFLHTRFPFSPHRKRVHDGVDGLAWLSSPSGASAFRAAWTFRAVHPTAWPQEGRPPGQARFAQARFQPDLDPSRPVRVVKPCRAASSFVRRRRRPVILFVVLLKWAVPSMSSGWIDGSFVGWSSMRIAAPGGSGRMRSTTPA